MARLLDIRDDDDSAEALRDITADPLAAVLDASGAPAPAPAAQRTEHVLDGDDIPEKYRKKTARDLLDVVRNQESLMGRHGQELGTLRAENESLRRLVDKALQFNSTANIPPSEDHERDALASGDPVQVEIRRAVEPLQNELTAQRRHMQAAEFASRHSTAPQDVNDPAFTDWVGRSPYRKKLASRCTDPADVDWEAAEELWVAYEEYRESASSPAAQPRAAVTPRSHTNPTVDDVSLVSGGGASGAGPEQDASKERFLESKLIALQERDPEYYWSAAVQQRIARGIVVPG